MKQDDRISGNQNNQPRERLVNVWSLLLLVITTVAALWLVSPSRESLVKLIARSSSPDVSLAFLEALDKNQRGQSDVILLMAKNHLALGHLEQAADYIEQLLYNNETKIIWPAKFLKLEIMLAKYVRANQENKPEMQIKIRQHLREMLPAPTLEFAQQLADKALSVTMPDVAYEQLLPYAGQSDITQDRLLRLALQSSNYAAALNHQLAIFYQNENIEALEALVKLQAMNENKSRLADIFTNYSGRLKDDPEYLALSANFAISEANEVLAKQRARVLIAKTDSHKILSGVSDNAIANGMLDVARILILAQVNNSSNRKNIQALHDLYLWQSNTKGALSMSQKLIVMGASAKQIRQGIKEAQAESDLVLESRYYSILAERDLIANSEYVRWIDSTEKSMGTKNTTEQVEKLLLIRPEDTDLINHSARLLSYRGLYSEVTNRWQQLKKIKSPSEASAIRYSNAYLKQEDFDNALGVLLSANRWQTFELDYLQSIFNLAWQLGKRQRALETLDYMLKNSDYDPKSGQNIFRFIRLNTPFDYEDIDMLVEKYSLWDSDELLLIAIELSSQGESQQKFKELLKLANKDEQLKNNKNILFFNLQIALRSEDPHIIKIAFQKIMDVYPNFKPPVSDYLWWLINNNELDELDNVYLKYKRSFINDENFWGVFAVASEKLGYLDDAGVWYKRILNNHLRNIALTSGTLERGKSLEVLPILLSYASLLERKGDLNRAFKIRNYIVSSLADELLSIEGGEVAYHSLVNIFAGKKCSSELNRNHLLKEFDDDKAIQFLADYIEKSRIDSFLFFTNRTELSKIEIPDWQLISVALSQNDREMLTRLLEQSVSISEAQRNLVMQRLDRKQDAWQHGESTIGRMDNLSAESQLRKIHIGQNPSKVRGIGGKSESIALWNIQRFELKYYTPFDRSAWIYKSSVQSIDENDPLINGPLDDEYRIQIDYRRTDLKPKWSFGLDIADGLGESRIGISADYLFNPKDDWSLQLGVAFNDDNESSQLMMIAGQDNRFSADLNYNISKREQVVIRVNFHDLSDRFDDSIATGWDMTLRLSEVLFFADPGWQVYTEYVTQQFSLSAEPLDGINSTGDFNRTLTSGDFIQENYSRLSFGQRFTKGLPGEPGATAPSPRYWFDTSMGYNIISEMFDYSFSAGLGWRIAGNDELYLSIDWLSQDVNGDESLRASVGYYFNF